MSKESNKNHKEKMSANEYFKAGLYMAIPLVVAGAIIVTCTKIMGPVEEKVEVWENNGDKLYYEGKCDEAILAYEKSGNDDQWPIWKVKQAEVYSSEGEIRKSNTLLKEAVILKDRLMNEDEEKYKDRESEFMNDVIFTFFINGEYEEATALAEEHIKENPNDNKVIKTLVGIYVTANKLDLAKDTLKKYKVDEKSAYDLALYAQMEIAVGQTDDGILTLEKAWSVDKNELKIYDVINEAKNFNSEFNVKVNEDIKLEDASYGYYYREAISEIKSGNYTAAFEDWKKSIAQNGTYVKNYTEFIKDLPMDQNENINKEAYYRLAFKEEPFSYDTKNTLAYYYTNDEYNYDEAYKYLDSLKVYGEDNAELYYELALLDEKEENYDEAAEWLQKSVELDEENSTYLRALSIIYLNDKRYDEAISVMRTIYDLDEEDVLNLNNIAYYYYVVEDDITRAFVNIESAYEDISSEVDKEYADIIESNYNKIKKVNDAYEKGERYTDPELSLCK